MHLAAPPEETLSAIVSHHCPQGYATMSPAMADMVAYPQYLFRRLAPALGRRIVEIGVGYGTYTGWLLERGDVLGSDIAVECLEAVRWKYPTPRLHLARIDLCDEATIEPCMAFGGDSIFCVNVLEHIPDDVRALAMLRRLVRPGGSLAIAVPAHPRLYGPMDAQAGHFRRYTRRSLASTLGRAGWTTQTTFYLNAVGAAGWWYHNRHRQAGLADEQVNHQMRAADRWLPRIARLTDPLTRRWFGLSVAAFAERTI
jgi:SAM-dependent methyltransferase